MTSLILLLISAIPAGYMHCHDHGKLKRLGRPGGFFSSQQWTRKYKPAKFTDIGMGLFRIAPDTWYYRFFDIPYEERFLFSATFLVIFVDAYHASQACGHQGAHYELILALSWPWYWVFIIWAAYATVHSIVYKLLSR